MSFECFQALQLFDEHVLGVLLLLRKRRFRGFPVTITFPKGLEFPMKTYDLKQTETKQEYLRVMRLSTVAGIWRAGKFGKLRPATKATEIKLV